MRSSKKLSAVALAVLAAGLSLTACNPDDSDAAATPSSSASAAADGQGSGASDGSAPAAKNDDGVTDPADGGDGSGPQDSTCLTKNLSMYAAVSPEVKDRTDVQISNDGEQTCTMKGFPTVDLGNTDDAVLHTRAEDAPAELVTLKPGDMAVFHLTYPTHAAPGSDLTEYTQLIVTTPYADSSQTITEIDGGPLAFPDDAHITVSPVE